jgi:hypothetical protein
VASAAQPTFVMHAPEHLQAQAREIDSLTSAGAFDEALLLTGRRDFGPPIHVVLMDENDPVVQELPRWVSGFAVSGRRVVTVIPARVPSYPDRNLTGLMVHEVAHILVGDAARGHRVPRWFNEGIATVAAREWGLEDHARYAAAAAGRRIATVDDLERGFRGSGREARRAYALSAAFIRWLRTEVDPQVTGRILEDVGRGESFENAFFGNTGMNLPAAEERFLGNRWLWATWVPFLTSSAVLWMAITALALVAIIRRTIKNREIRHRWDLEEAAAAPSGVTRLPRGDLEDGEVIN